MADRRTMERRRFLKEISDSIPDSQLIDLIFLCKIDNFKAEKITRAFEVFDVLEQRGELTINNFTALKQVLNNLKRVDLKNRVEEFEKKLAQSGRPVAAAAEVKGEFNQDWLQRISREIGTNWKMIARRLEVNEKDIEEIDHDYRRLREQSYQAMLQWVENCGGFAKANPLELKQALEDYKLIRIAEDFFNF